MAWYDNYGEFQRGIGGAFLGAGKFLGRAVQDQFSPFGQAIPEFGNQTPPAQIGSPPPPVPGIQRAIESPGWTPPEIPSPYGQIGQGPYLPAIERALAEREPDAPREPSRVNVTMNGQTYDYANGREGGAPRIDGDAGPGSVQAFGRTINSPGGGAYSQLLDNPNLTPERSIEAAIRKRDLEDVQPAEGRLGEIGATRGEARPIEAAIYGKEREAGIRSQANAPKERAEIEKAMARQQIVRQLEELKRRLAESKATPEETTTAVNDFLRDAITEQGLREGDLGPVASMLKSPY
jgi:hypothetical protein